jgi:hypothetical protein
MKFVRILVALLGLAAALSPASAQELTPAETEAVQTAVARGQLLYAYDQAAWHGTDAVLAEAKKRRLTDKLPQMLGGWIVAGTATDPKVIFFDKNESEPRAVFVVQLADGGSRVLATRFVDVGEESRIDEDTRSLIRARSVASSSIAGTQLMNCASGPLNTAVLPPERAGGPALVYFLSAQQTLDAVPFGGHHRIEVSADGSVGPVHAFTKSCIALPTRQAKKNAEALVVSQLQDPVPTEASVFTSLAAGLPIYVVTTPNGKVWHVANDQGRSAIRLLKDKVDVSSAP